MNQVPQDGDELSELFERSAAKIDPVTQGRLRVLAREIPERRDGFWTWPRWPWAAVVGALGATGALVLIGLRTAPVAAPSVALSAPAPAQQAPLPVFAESAVATHDEVDEDSNSFELDDALGTDALDDLALDPGDLADAEVDAWISAAKSTLGG